ncbi:MAG: ATP-binding protein, partial [Terriglobia bacterium]
MRPDILVPVHEQTDVAAARRVAAKAGLKAGFEEREAGELALIVTEAASNQIKHAGGGDIVLRDLS